MREEVVRRPGEKATTPILFADALDFATAQVDPIADHSWTVGDYFMRENQLNASRDSKQTYEKPVVTRIGTLEDVTQHASTGHALDAGYPAGTAGSSLTFSD